MQFRHNALIVLQKSCSGMKSQDAEENVLVVCKVGHRLDKLNMGMFGALTAGVISVAPQHNLPDLVQNAVCLFEIPG